MRKPVGHGRVNTYRTCLTKKTRNRITSRGGTSFTNPPAVGSYPVQLVCQYRPRNNHSIFFDPNIYISAWIIGIARPTFNFATQWIYIDALCTLVISLGDSSRPHAEPNPVIIGINPLIFSWIDCYIFLGSRGNPT